MSAFVPCSRDETCQKTDDDLHLEFLKTDGVEFLALCKTIEDEDVRAAIEALLEIASSTA